MVYKTQILLLAMKQKSPQDLEKFYSVIEQTADSIFITDQEGIIEYVNPAFEKLTGFKKKEVLRKTPRIVKSGLYDQQYYQQFWSTIRSGKTSRATVINKKKSGELFFADHTVTPLKDKGGKITHFVGIWKDITKQVQLEKKKEEFLAIASHELKNPLATIKAYTQLLEKKLGKSNLEEENLFFLSQINTQTDKITKFLKELLDLTKIEAGKLVLEKKTFDLNDLISKIVKNLQYLVPTHQIIIRGEVKDKVYGNAERIGQVLINLITNAVKYSPKGNKIIIKLKSNKKDLIVSVQDFGKGISKKDQKYIFDRFFRVEKKEKKGDFGLGLGLYISAEIIKNHGGKIWLESETGKGSTFYFSLPISMNKEG